MQFLPNGPDIPTGLIAAQEKGETLFICGAGVSCTVGLPLFRGLVKGVYQELGKTGIFILQSATACGLANMIAS